MFPVPVICAKVATTVAVSIAKPAPHALQEFRAVPAMQPVAPPAANAVRVQ
ncbi:MAG: hypothetical protein HON04_02625 [Planctomicrobium sp.]|nr:hypothetical protein [Planctomicrobium sp.]